MYVFSINMYIVKLVILAIYSGTKRWEYSNWESVTLIRIYLNITWTQQGLRIGYFDFSQVHSRRYFCVFSQVHSRRYFSEFSQVHSRRYFSKFPRYTAGFIFRIFPGTQQAIFLRFAPGTQQVLYVTNHHKIVGIQQVLKLKNVT